MKIHKFNIGGKYKGWALRLGGLKIEIIWMKHKWNFKLEISNTIEW